MWYMNAVIGRPIIGHQREFAEGLEEVTDETMAYIDSCPADYIWDGETVVTPSMVEPTIEPPYVPQIIKMRQCQLYLYDIEMLEPVNQAVLNMSPKAQIEWNTSDEVWRTSPMVEQMRLMFGWTVAQMDQMFIDAAAL